MQTEENSEIAHALRRLVASVCSKDSYHLGQYAILRGGPRGQRSCRVSKLMESTFPLKKILRANDNHHTSFACVLNELRVAEALLNCALVHLLEFIGGGRKGT